MEATQMFNDRWMDKEIAVHIYNGILLSHKKGHIESVRMRWTNLEPIIQGAIIITVLYRVSQKEKDK